MRRVLALATVLLAPGSLAQPTVVTPVADGVSIRTTFAPVDPADVRTDTYGQVARVGPCEDFDRLIPLVVTSGVDGTLRGVAFESAVVRFQRAATADSVALDVGCLFWGPPDEIGDEDGYPLYTVSEVPPPLAGGWELATGWGESEGFSGGWVIGYAPDAHRTDAPVPFIEADAPPTTERVRTELVLLYEGVRRQREAVAACAAAAPDGRCTDPDVMTDLDGWLRALEEWALYTASFQD